MRRRPTRPCQGCGQPKQPGRGLKYCETCIPLRPLAKAERRQTRRWAQDLRRRYGITFEQYEAMLAAQGGVCAICRRECRPAGQRLGVDHDHVTGAIRGLLCRRCNSFLAVIEDQELFAQFRAYLAGDCHPILAAADGAR